MPLVVVARDSDPGQGFVMLVINTTSCAMDENRVLFSLIRVGVFLHYYGGNVSDIIREKYLSVADMLYFNFSEHKTTHC